MADLPDPAQPPELRVSNADRERVAALLQRASADGRLDLDELDERLRAAYAAKTHGELAPLTGDLPAETAAAEASAVPQPNSRWALAVMGGFTRRGAWVVSRRFRAIIFCGGGKIDLRHARFAENEVRIRVFALMGGAEVIVPPEAHVNVSGVAIMGGWDQPDQGASTPGGPRVTVGGFTLMGGVGVKRQRRRKQDQE